MTASKIPVLLMARELHIGGSERQMTETAMRLDRSVFTPHVGCFSSTGIRGDELRDAGLPIVQFPVHSFRSPVALREARRLVRYIRDNRIRIVHTWDYPLNVWAIPTTRAMTRAIAISSQRSHRDLIPPALRGPTRFSDRMAHAILANCEYVRRHLIAEHVPESKVRVCRNGIDLDRFQRRAMPAHPLTVGVVCALRPEKDLPTLLRAFALVRDLPPDLRLLIVGSGDQQPGLDRLAAALQLNDRCRFEPAVAAVPERLSAIDIFVLPSCSEAFSNSLMEAMACGCCVLASDVGGNPELVCHGETGLLFPPGDVAALAERLRAVISDSTLRAHLAHAGERFIRESFSSSGAAARMATIYLELLESRGPSVQ